MLLYSFYEIVDLLTIVVNNVLIVVKQLIYVYLNLNYDKTMQIV